MYNILTGLYNSVITCRYNIAVQAAHGLCYLHHDCSPLIVHRDVKSNNILLDSTFHAHVADFGLAKLFQDTGKTESMSSIAGSYGYIAPGMSLSTLRKPSGFVICNFVDTENLTFIINIECEFPSPNVHRNLYSCTLPWFLVHSRSLFPEVAHFAHTRGQAIEICCMRCTMSFLSVFSGTQGRLISCDAWKSCRVCVHT